MTTTATNTTGTGASALPAAGGSSSSTLSEWAGPYVTNMLGRAQALADRPYETYQGPLTAGTSALQSKYFQGLGNLTFPSQLGGSFTSGTAPTLPTASATGTTSPTAAQPTGVAAQYMNPYLQAVLNPQLNELNRQAQIQQQQNAGRLAQAGAYGGGRQAIMDAELQRNLMDQMSKTIGTGYSNAFDAARQQFNVEQGQAKTLADTIAQAGAQQRAIEQEGVTADLNEFLQQRDYPLKQTQFLQSMLQGLPISTVTNTPAQMSKLGELSATVGGLGSLITSLKNLGVNLGG
jgi:hypothetical protein